MLIRVFEMPANGFAQDFLFHAGLPATFLEIDWFRDEDGLLDKPNGRQELTDFIKAKRYYTPGRAYLVLHPVHPFTIGYEAP